MQTISEELAFLRVAVPSLHFDVLDSSGWSQLVQGFSRILPYHADRLSPRRFLEDVLVEMVSLPSVLGAIQQLAGSSVILKLFFVLVFFGLLMRPLWID